MLSGPFSVCNVPVPCHTCCYYTGCTLIELMAFRGGRLNEQQCAIEVAIPLLTALAGLHGLGVVRLLWHAPFSARRPLCIPLALGFRWAGTLGLLWAVPLQLLWAVPLLAAVVGSALACS